MKPGIFKHRIVQNVTIFGLLASNMILETKILTIYEKYNNLKIFKEKTLNIGKSSNTLHLGMGSSSENGLKSYSIKLITIISIISFNKFSKSQFLEKALHPQHRVK